MKGLARRCPASSPARWAAASFSCATAAAAAATAAVLAIGCGASRGRRPPPLLVWDASSVNTGVWDCEFCQVGLQVWATATRMLDDSTMDKARRLCDCSRARALTY
jgi:hypothetical protein